MSAEPLHAIDGGAETASEDGHKPDALARLQAARKAPQTTLDESGKVLRKLAAANKLAGLKGPTSKQPGTRIVRVTERGDEYDLELENGACISATAAQLFDRRHMEPKLTAATKSGLPDGRGGNEWRPFAIAVIQASEPDNATGTEQDETREWLRAFLAARTVTGKPVDLSDSAALYPVIRVCAAFYGSDGRLYVRPSELLAYVAQTLKQRCTGREVAQRLGRLGFTKPRNAEGKLAARHDGNVATNRYLASEPGFEVD